VLVGLEEGIPPIRKTQHFLLSRGNWLIRLLLEDLENDYKTGVYVFIYAVCKDEMYSTLQKMVPQQKGKR